jgi:hypothetical protein
MIIYLYHKRHRKTGLNYFGKTTKEPYNYLGSGKYWRRHLNKHGPDVETINVWEFNDQSECSNFALSFSKENNIVESKNWANLKDEDGKDGGDPGPIGRKKISESKLGKKHTPEQNQKKSERQQGTTKSSEWVEKRSGKNHHFYGKSRPDMKARTGEAHHNYGKTWKKKPDDIEKQKGDNNPMKNPKWQMTCEHCGILVNKGLYGRWHGNKCRVKK